MVVTELKNLEILGQRLNPAASCLRAQDMPTTRPFDVHLLRSCGDASPMTVTAGGIWRMLGLSWSRKKANSEAFDFEALKAARLLPGGCAITPCSALVKDTDGNIEIIQPIMAQYKAYDLGQICASILKYSVNILNNSRLHRLVQIRDCSHQAELTFFRIAKIRYQPSGTNRCKYIINHLPIGILATLSRKDCNSG